MRLPKQWLSILSVNSIFLFNLGFPLLTLPTILHRGEVIAQTDPNAEADRLYDRGVELFQQGTAESYQQAIVAWEKALQLYQQDGDLEGQALILAGLGRIYSDLGDKQTALDYLNQSLPLWRQVGDKKREGIVLALIRDIGQNNSTDPNAQAERLLQQGLELFRQGTAESLKQAIAVSEKALKLYQEAGNLERQALSLPLLGRIYSDLGDKQTALDYYNQSLPLSRQVGNKALEATTLNNIGLVYSALGDKQTALEFYNQSLPLSRQVGNKAGEALTLNNIGLVYDALGDKQQALDFYNQSLPLSRQVGNKAGEAATLTNIGRVYSDLGDRQTALDFYNQSLPLS
jgi:tetratricopeptide (TPR) repeat protein